MTGRRFVVWFARSAIIAFSVTTAFVGCSRQGEGERCDWIAAGDTDCDVDDGLECVRCVNLVEGIIDRCCPKDAGSETDDRCRRSDPPRPAEACPTGDTGTGGTTGSGGTTSSGGTAGSGGMSGAGGSSTPTGGMSGEGGAPDSAGAGGV